MNSIIKSGVAAAVLALCGASVFAQVPVSRTQEVIQREVNQQQRVENGLKDGSLTAREAARIERDEAGIARTIAHDEAKGPLTASEQRSINRRENAASRDIHALRGNDRIGNPHGATSRRLQADVQRNVNQGKRIESGVRDGQLTNRDVASVERGQARVDAREVRAAHNGHVSVAEQRRIQHAENRQSRRIRRERAEG